jgi:phospholipase/carboxylesterase
MHDLAGLAPAISQTGYVYVCPNGPVALDMGNGMTGYAWTLPGENFDASQAVQEAEEAFDGFFQEVTETYNVKPGQALLLGFSQGGGMAYRYGLPRPESFAGVVALSSFLSDSEALEERLPIERTQSVFIAHGLEDPVVPVERGRASCASVDQWGYECTYREFSGMGHEINNAVLGELVPWIQRVLPPAGGGLILP